MSDFDDLVDDDLGPELVDQFGTEVSASIGGSTVTLTAAVLPERGEAEQEALGGGRDSRKTREMYYDGSDAAIALRTAVTIDAVVYIVSAIEHLGGDWRKATLERSTRMEQTRPGYRG